MLPSIQTAAQPMPLAVHSIDELVFSVPDLAVARHFYTSFGLDVRLEQDRLSLYTFGHPHRWATIVAGETKKLQWLTLGIFPEDEDRFARRLEELCIPRITAPVSADPGGIWLEGPDGLAIQLRVAEKCSPSAPAPREFPPENHNLGRAPHRSQLAAVRPLYLSHILLFSSAVLDASDFYERVLGLRVSDKSGEVISFMHTPHGSDHHLIALAKSSGLGLHHTSWCVPSIDAVGTGSDQMTTAGYPDGWGIGRHVLGSNYFRYVRDPWGSYAEYSFDIDYVEAGAEWPAGDHASEDALYAWGPDLPDNFISNFEVS